MIGLWQHLSEIFGYLTSAITVVYSDLHSLVIDNSSAVFGLLGAVVGGVGSYFTAKNLKVQEFKLQVKSKLLDRQIAAHENILKIAVEMRVMTGSGHLDDTGEIIRYPQILQSKDSFESWFIKFTELQLEGTTWLITSTKREVNFVQDYLVNLQRILIDVPSELYPKAGLLIYEDFRELSNTLEKRAYEFFEGNISGVKLANLSVWHKYERSLTESRLLSTKLIQNESDIKKFSVCSTK